MRRTPILNLVAEQPNVNPLVAYPKRGLTLSGEAKDQQNRLPFKRSDPFSDRLAVRRFP